jgi:integral membrane sensor domain MASE1
MNLILQAKPEVSATAPSRALVSVLTEFLRARNFEARLAVFAAYLFAAYASIELQHSMNVVPTFWAPAGIATAAFLIQGPSVWYLVFCAAFISNLSATGSIIGSCLMSSGQTLGPLVAAFITSHSTEKRKLFFTPRNVLRFAFVAAPVAAAISAGVGAATFCLIGCVPKAVFMSVLLSWWQGDAVGLIALTPVIVLLTIHHRHALETSESKSLLAAMLGLIFVCILIFCPNKLTGGNRYDMQFLALPILAVFVTRYCPMETSIANTIIAGFTFWTPIHNRGPFSSDYAPAYVSAAFIPVICVTNLVLSAAFAADRENSENQLILSEVKLASKRVEIAELKAQLNGVQNLASAGGTDSDSRTLKSSNQEPL